MIKTLKSMAGHETHAAKDKQKCSILNRPVCCYSETIHWQGSSRLTQFPQREQDHSPLDHLYFSFMADLLTRFYLVEMTLIFIDIRVERFWTQGKQTICIQMYLILAPWTSLGQNTGVSSLSLLQWIFPTQGSNRGLPHCRQILYQLSQREVEEYWGG